jgi:long-subunit fatty acid transport protein
MLALIVEGRWRRTGPSRIGLLLALTLVVCAASVGADDPAVPAPTPIPPGPTRIDQDQLDLQGQSSVALGSGARALGMGGAFLARADDATAASWNPAGLSYLRAPELTLVWADSGLDIRAVAARGVGGAAVPQATKADDGRGNWLDFAAGTYPLRLGPVSGSVQLSLQRVISFTSNRTIQRPSESRLTTIESRGGFDVLALGTGFQISRGVRLGATLNRWVRGYHQVLDEESRKYPTHQEQTFNLSGWNANFGVIWSPVSSLNLGAVANSGFTGEVSLQRYRTDQFEDPDAPETTANAYGRSDVHLDFPRAFGVGASWRPRSGLTLSADYTRTQWSKSRIRPYFTLERTTPGLPPPVPKPPTDYWDELLYPTLTDPQQADPEQWRFGIEYVLIRGRVKWPLRGGFFTDKQYFLAADGRPPVFKGWTVGTGLIAGPLLFDVAYVRQWSDYTTAEVFETGTTPVANEVRGHRLVVSVIYRHARSGR